MTRDELLDRMSWEEIWEHYAEQALTHEEEKKEAERAKKKRGRRR